jgi:hypothetical protein
VELLGVMFEVGCCLLEFIDIAAIITNLIAWSKSADHRVARKQARTVGAEPPPKDFWFQLLAFSTPIALTLTGLVVYKYVRWLIG